MPKRQPQWHTAHALAAYIAQNTELPLCAASLAAAVKKRIPEAELLREGRIRLEGNVFDLFA